MPIHDGEQAANFHSIVDGPGKTRLVRDPMKCVSQKYMICRVADYLRHVVCIGLYKLDIWSAATFRKSHFRGFK